MGECADAGLPLVAAVRSPAQLALLAHSCAGGRINRVEVADGVAVVLPYLQEDHVQARQDGLGVVGSPVRLALAPSLALMPISLSYALAAGRGSPSLG